MLFYQLDLLKDMDELVLFSFDDYAIQFKHGVYLDLLQAVKYEENPVLTGGEEGSSDAFGIVFNGTVLYLDGKFRMWYVALPVSRTEAILKSLYEIGYAESEDGIHWTKPRLRLVEHNGSFDNNLCLLEPRGSPFTRIIDCVGVMHDPDDPDPARKYKMIYLARVPREGVRESREVVASYEGKVSNWSGANSRPIFHAACSEDGFRWRAVSDKALVDIEFFEGFGVYKFGEFYYAVGQSGWPSIALPEDKFCGRTMIAFRSKDFIEWSNVPAFAFIRPGYRPAPHSSGEEAHLGAGIWNRGNVLIGLYGQWHGHPKASGIWDRRDLIKMDVGLIVSNDGIHYREPCTDFAVIPGGGESEWDHGALMFGQAFANVGNQTYIWYGGPWWANWPHLQEEHPAVGLATLRRDGFGYLRLQNEFYNRGSFITCPIRLAGTDGARLYVNAEGLSDSSFIQVDLMGMDLRPISGYSGSDSVRITRSGLREQVVWRGREVISGLKESTFMIKAHFHGTEKETPKVYALYLVPTRDRT